MDAAEVEFLAEKELVTIIPNFSLDKIYLIGGDLGPFNPGLPVQVPLWLAVNLKQRQKCRLLPPEWMDVEKLEKIRDHERKEETFTPMPSPYYMELTKLLLNQEGPGLPSACDPELDGKAPGQAPCRLLPQPECASVEKAAWASPALWSLSRLAVLLVAFTLHSLAPLFLVSQLCRPSSLSRVWGHAGLSHFHTASDNIPKADEIRTLIKDVWDTRIAKFRVSADSFVRQQEAHAKLDNLTLMEINTSGAFLTQALNHMYKLRTNLQPSDSAQSQDF
uniref:DNA replication complex GINS protein PSF2 n=1 Tax=Bos taurus TaxID=9913 RepID=E1BC42_BOVIN